jgi:hypothetical protein
LLAAETEHALPAADSHDETAFGENNGNLADFSARGRADAGSQCNKGDQSRTGSKSSHGDFPFHCDVA